MELHHKTAAGTTAVTKRVSCIVKLGGSAITCKNQLETIHEENLKIVSSQLRQAMVFGPCRGMDWSRRAGCSDIPNVVDEFDDQLVVESNKFVVVHGAGGHLV